MQQPCIDTPVLPLLTEESMRRGTAGALQNDEQESQNGEQLERMDVLDTPRTEQETALSSVTSPTPRPRISFPAPVYATPFHIHAGIPTDWYMPRND